MATNKLLFKLPNGKTLTVGVEESITAKSFIEKLKNQQVLDLEKSYLLKTQTGTNIRNEDTFFIYKGNDFIIIENSDSFPQNKFGSSDFRVGKISAPETFQQLGILLLDGSGSMTDPAKLKLTKAQSVHVAVKDLLTRMKGSRIANNFSFAVVAFGEDIKIHTTITRLASIDDNGNFDPLIVDGSNTKIFAGLNEAKSFAERFLNEAPEGGVRHSVIILLMSDGICSQPKTTIAVSENLKSNPKIQIACAYFGTLGVSNVEAEDLLKEISSDPTRFYKTTYGAEDLRKFFEDSISKSVGIKIG